VLRGKFILDNVLGTPPPPPPDVVPRFRRTSSQQKAALGARTARAASSAIRRARVAIASSIRGLALENFDAVGRMADARWRHTRDAGRRVGQLVDGTRVTGVVSCARPAARSATFVGTMTERLLTYAMDAGSMARHAGRRSIVRDAERDELPFSIDRPGVCAERPVQMRMKARGEAENRRTIDEAGPYGPREENILASTPRRRATGLGATLAPLLDAMVPALSGAAQTRKPTNGSAPCSSDGRAPLALDAATTARIRVSPILQPLNRFANR
jgi:hypothetical protein